MSLSSHNGSSDIDAADTIQIATSVASTSPSSSPSTLILKSFRCLSCPRSFSRKQNLNTHIQTHLGVKPFACRTCDSVFTRRHDLQRHERSHTGAKPYRCTACARTFSRMDARNRHIRGDCKLVLVGANNCTSTLTATTTITASNNPVADDLIALDVANENDIILNPARKRRQRKSNRSFHVQLNDSNHNNNNSLRLPQQEPINQRHLNLSSTHSIQSITAISDEQVTKNEISTCSSLPYNINDTRPTIPLQLQSLQYSRQRYQDTFFCCNYNCYTHTTQSSITALPTHRLWIYNDSKCQPYPRPYLGGPADPIVGASWAYTRNYLPSLVSSALCSHKRWSSDLPKLHANSAHYYRERYAPYLSPRFHQHYIPPKPYIFVSSSLPDILPAALPSLLNPTSSYEHCVDTARTVKPTFLSRDSHNDDNLQPVYNANNCLPYNTTDEGRDQCEYEVRNERAEQWVYSHYNNQRKSPEMLTQVSSPTTLPSTPFPQSIQPDSLPAIHTLPWQCCHPYMPYHAYGTDTAFQRKKTNG